MSDKNIKQLTISNTKRSPLPMMLMVFFCAALFFYDKHINKKINDDCAGIKNICELNKAKLHKEISDLKNIIENLPTKHDAQPIVMHSANARKKWNAWIELYKKIKSAANFDKELNVFNAIFSDDAYVLHAVSSILPNQSENKFFTNMMPTSMRKYLKSIIDVRSKQVQDDILLEISGYVLASIIGISQ